MAQYADTVLVLAERQAIACGPPHVVMTTDILSRAFGYPMTAVPHPWLDCPLIVSGERPSSAFLEQPP